MTTNEAQARLTASELARTTGETHIVFARSCDRFVVRAESDAKSAYAYASPIATYEVHKSPRDGEQEVLFSLLSDAPAHCAELSKRADLPIGPTCCALVLLELAGRAKRLPGGMYVKL